jgi:hypothetical protein
VQVAETSFWISGGSDTVGFFEILGPPALGGHESNKVALDVLSEDIVNNT